MNFPAPGTAARRHASDVQGLVVAKMALEGGLDAPVLGQQPVDGQSGETPAETGDGGDTRRGQPEPFARMAARLTLATEALSARCPSY